MISGGYNVNYGEGGAWVNNQIIHYQTSSSSAPLLGRTEETPSQVQHTCSVVGPRPPYTISYPPHVIKKMAERPGNETTMTVLQTQLWNVETELQKSQMKLQKSLILLWNILSMNETFHSLKPIFQRSHPMLHWKVAYGKCSERCCHFLRLLIASHWCVTYHKMGNRIWRAKVTGPS